MTAPSEVLIGPYLYHITARKMKLFGLTDNHKSRISVDERQSASNLRDTVLHEILHAVMWCAGAQKLLDIDGDFEEKVARLFAPWLLGVIRDNPDLIDFLREDS